jgi:hypothetical protein
MFCFLSNPGAALSRIIAYTSCFGLSFILRRCLTWLSFVGISFSLGLAQYSLPCYSLLTHCGMNRSGDSTVVRSRHRARSSGCELTR